jgi:hypothetical protein
VKLGNAFRLNSVTSDNHIWVAAYVSNDTVVIFNFTSWQLKKDHSCVVKPREYPELKHDSVIAYMHGTLLKGQQIQTLESYGIREYLELGFTGRFKENTKRRSPVAVHSGKNTEAFLGSLIPKSGTLLHQRRRSSGFGVPHYEQLQLQYSRNHSAARNTKIARCQGRWPAQAICRDRRLTFVNLPSNRFMRRL